MVARFLANFLVSDVNLLNSKELVKRLAYNTANKAKKKPDICFSLKQI